MHDRSLTFLGMKMVVDKDIPDGAMALISRGQRPVMSFDRKPTADEVRRTHDACVRASIQSILPRD